ncbi:MAG TPA: nicotinamide-nucleotide amidohydrolase family protein, partial [Bryobacteraceae bacterium]|nr:nicotinamide-nucleotide amidohydrolase family protein [Bryobacteraceae bacterium]
FNAEIGESIEARFRRMNRAMPEINKRQAMVIDGAEILANDRGTAPGQWIEEGNGKVIVILPGPPHELKAMFARECLPRLEKMLPPVVIRTLALRISGMSESELDQTISPIYKKYENPVTTVLAHNGDMQVHFRARCATEEQASALLAEVGEQVDAVLGERIYSRTGEPLESVIGNKLTARGQTLVVAESATGGSLADRISSVPGSSAYFLGGFVTYARRLKTSLLGVPAETVATYGAVSRETAQAMAEGARSHSGADWALAITGNAGPSTDGDEAPVGTVYVALSGPNGTEVNHRVWPASDRQRIRAFAGQMALDMLNRKLQ